MDSDLPSAKLQAVEVARDLIRPAHAVGDPGVVPIQEWRPDHTLFDPPKDLTNLGGVARKA